MMVGLALASKSSALTAELSSGLESAVAVGEDEGLTAGEFVAGRDVADGTVVSSGDVVLDEVGGDAARLVDCRGRCGSQGRGLEGLVPALELPVGLGIAG
jgi:hypothetical protein